MRANIDIFNVFRDGILTEVAGRIPQVRFQIYIPYLRQLFPGAGHSFYLLMSGCKGLQFLSFGENTYIDDFQKIQNDQLEFLTCIEFGESAHITCTTGKLEILYSDLKIHLDTGEAVSFEALKVKSQAYWDGFDDPPYV